ncbi:amidohydrolase family protein [Paenibacillus hodogayensis]|uniref:Amidohydrolase family protein n=1 Tax=Paenibacillus hodogayensis TaxID=279208 RepID=A0ABV5W594_9BACL
MTAIDETGHEGEQSIGRGKGLEEDARKAVRTAAGMLAPFTAQKAIDLTAFMGQWPMRLPVRASAADVSAMADRLGLEGVCVSHIASIFGFDTHEGNAELLRDCSADKRLWPYAIVNPEEAGWERELDWAVGAGARGIRLVPGYHRYSVASPSATELVKRVGRYGLPLHLCVRLEDERLVHPRYPVDNVPYHEVMELLRRAEDVPIVLSGLRAQEWTDITEYLNDDEREEREKRILLDLWFTNGPIGAIAGLCRKGEAGRFGYGSCWPIQVPEATALQLAAAPIDEEERAALCRGNAVSLLGLRS